MSVPVFYIVCIYSVCLSCVFIVYVYRVYLQCMYIVCIYSVWKGKCLWFMHDLSACVWVCACTSACRR